MTSAEIGTSDPTSNSVLEAAAVLTERLSHVSEADERDAPELMVELTIAQHELAVAFEKLQVQTDRSSSSHRAETEQRAKRQMIAHMPVAVLKTDATGTIVWSNRLAETLLRSDALSGDSLRTFVAAGKQDTFDSLLVETNAPPNVGLSDRHVELRADLEPLAIELVASLRTRESDRQSVITWVLRPSSTLGLSQQTDVRLAHVLGRLCQLPLITETLQDLLGQVARLYEDLCAPHSSVSVSIGCPGDPEQVATASQFAQQMDGAQQAAHEGPSRDAWASDAVVHVANIHHDSRWPDLAVEAESLDVATVFSAPIHAGPELIGVLTIYSGMEFEDDEATIDLLVLLADSAGAVIEQVNEEGRLKDLTCQLKEAMASREIIEQAKGILMGRFNCSAQEALTRLSKVSQNRNIRMRLVAQALVDEFPST